MSILHMVNKSPFEKSSLLSCLKFVRSGSAILLIEDGIYAALRDTEAACHLQAAVSELPVYVLGPDLKARGFAAAPLIEGIEVVDYGGFVDLAARYDKVQSWL